MPLIAVKLSRRILLILILSLAAPLPVLAASLLGDIFPIAADPVRSESAPTAAFNSTRGEYLVVWTEEMPDGAVCGQRFSQDGGKIGGTITLASGDHTRKDPDIVYNHLQDQYLVVWAIQNYKNESGIRARRLTGAGALIDTADIILVADSDDYIMRPVAAYSPKADRYLVVWEESASEEPLNNAILAQIITPGGHMEGPVKVIAQSDENRAFADIAYQPLTQRYLVVWADQNGRLDFGLDILGQQLNENGSLVGTDILLASHSGLSLMPCVAALSDPGAEYPYLVVYDTHPNPGESDVYGRFIKGDGTPGTAITLANSEILESNPAVAGSAGAGKYLVTWSQGDFEVDLSIFARLYTGQGEVYGGTHILPGQTADKSALAAGGGGSFLITWQDYVGEDINIYGALLGRWQYLPLISR